MSPDQTAAEASLTLEPPDPSIPPIIQAEMAGLRKLADRLQAERATAQADEPPAVEAAPAAPAPAPKAYRRDPVFEFERDSKLPGIAESQLCRMFGFGEIDGSGEFQPDLDELHKAQADPKAYFDADWLWPSERRRLAREELDATTAKVAAARQARQAALQTPEPKAPRTCPETVEQLHDEGVSPEQIARMHGLTAEQLRQYADEHGLKIRKLRQPIPEPFGA
jgi:hypothetical protein